MTLEALADLSDKELRAELRRRREERRERPRAARRKPQRHPLATGEGLTETELDALSEILIGLTAPHTLDDLGAWLGVSRERIRQREVSALTKLRVALERRGWTMADLFEPRHPIPRDAPRDAAPQRSSRL